MHGTVVQTTAMAKLYIELAAAPAPAPEQASKGMAFPSNLRRAVSAAQLQCSAAQRRG